MLVKMPLGMDDWPWDSWEIFIEKAAKGGLTARVRALRWSKAKH
jgi:hypothetical protein